MSYEITAAETDKEVRAIEASKRKIAMVEAQVRAMLRAETNALNCPYCDAQNFPPPDGFESALCCAELAQTVNAVSDKLQSNELLDAADRISQNAAKQVSLN